MPTLLVRPSLSTRKPVTSQATTIGPRPQSARSFICTPLRSEQHPYAVTRVRAKDETTKVSTVQAKPPYKGLLLKTVKTKPVDDGRSSTVNENSNSNKICSLLHSKPRSKTLSSRPASLASGGLDVRSKTLRNITTSAPRATIASSPAPLGQKIGPENWTPVRATKVTTQAPPPKLKLLKHRRGTVLPKTGATSLFSQIQPRANQTHEDVFYDRERTPSPSFTSSLTTFLSPHATSVKLHDGAMSYQHAPGVRRARSTLTLPSHRGRTQSRAICKTVTWDPSILYIGPETNFCRESTFEEDNKDLETTVAPMQAPANEIDVEDCIKTIKELGKADRLKLTGVMEALKQLKLDSECCRKDNEDTVPDDNRTEDVAITTVRSMDPRVPDFQSLGIFTARNKLNSVEISKEHRSVESTHGSFDIDGNKENIPEISFQHSAKSRDNGCNKRKKIVVLDDISSPGREVNSFDHWYGEMQLEAFTKRYPLTGMSASFVRGAAGTSETGAGAFGCAKSISGWSEGRAVAATDGSRGDNSVSRMKDIKRVGRKVDEGLRTNNGRRYNFTAKEHFYPQRRNIITPSGPEAAFIQQKLELLLLQKKERKALQDMPDLSKFSMQHYDCQHPTWMRNPYQDNLNHDGGNFLGGAEWIPSERLRL